MALFMNDMGEFVEPDPKPKYHFKMPEKPRFEVPKQQVYARKCPVCGKWFEPKTYNHRICTEACRKAARK